ncbi:MAG: phosphoribosylglycinamide synthetase C domain-containing protein [Faecalibacillus sp.]
MSWKDEHVACLVLAAPGYPGSYPKGSVITGFEKVDNDIIIFHAGTAFNDKDEVVTNGGRVLNICALGCSLEETRKRFIKQLRLFSLMVNIIVKTLV